MQARLTILPYLTRLLQTACWIVAAAVLASPIGSCSKSTRLQLEYYPDGTNRESVHFLVDSEVRHGEYIRWHSTGVIAEIGEYSNGIRIGEWTWRDSNGKVTRNGKYSGRGVRVNKWQYWDNGTLIREEICDDNGILDGPFFEAASAKSRFQDDAVSHSELRGEIEEGVRVGEWVESLIDDGSLEHPYWNGVKVIMKGHFDLENRRSGVWTMEIPALEEAWKELGIRPGELGGTYNAGVKIGRWVEWSPSYNIMVGEYENGKKTGYWTYSSNLDWRSEGGYVNQAPYQNGKLSSGVRILSGWNAEASELPPGSESTQGLYKVDMLSYRSYGAEVVYPELYCRIEGLDQAILARKQGIEYSPGMLASRRVQKIPVSGNAWSKALVPSVSEALRGKTVYEWKVYIEGKLSEDLSGVYLETTRILSLEFSWS